MTLSHQVVFHPDIHHGDGEAALDELDRLRTYKQAAAILNVGYHVVQRAARKGLVPTFRLGTSRPYVKLRDFLELLDRDRSN